MVTAARCNQREFCNFWTKYTENTSRYNHWAAHSEGKLESLSSKLKILLSSKKKKKSKGHFLTWLLTQHNTCRYILGHPRSSYQGEKNPNQIEMSDQIVTWLPNKAQDNKFIIKGEGEYP